MLVSTSARAQIGNELFPNSELSCPMCLPLTGGALTGALTISTATASFRTLTLQSTDDSTTLAVFELQNAAGTRVYRVNAAGTSFSPNGTAAAPAITALNDPDNGFFFGTNTLGLTAGGTQFITGVSGRITKWTPGQTTIAADDTTPDVSSGIVFVTSANTGATAITDLDLPNVGTVLWICGGSATNSSTIADSGNFNLSAAFTAGLDDCIQLYVQADNDYFELSRVNN